MFLHHASQYHLWTIRYTQLSKHFPCIARYSRPLQDRPSLPMQPHHYGLLCISYNPTIILTFEAPFEQPLRTNSCDMFFNDECFGRSIRILPCSTLRINRIALPCRTYRQSLSQEPISIYPDSKISCTLGGYRK